MQEGKKNPTTSTKNPTLIKYKKGVLMEGNQLNLAQKYFWLNLSFNAETW